MLKKDLTGPTLLEMSGFPTNQELTRSTHLRTELEIVSLGSDARQNLLHWLET